MAHLDSAQAKIELRRDLPERVIFDVAELKDLAIGIPGGEIAERQVLSYLSQHQLSVERLGYVA